MRKDKCLPPVAGKPPNRVVLHLCRAVTWRNKAPSAGFFFTGKAQKSSLQRYVWPVVLVHLLVHHEIYLREQNSSSSTASQGMGDCGYCQGFSLEKLFLGMWPIWPLQLQSLVCIRRQHRYLLWLHPWTGSKRSQTHRPQLHTRAPHKNISNTSFGFVSLTRIVKLNPVSDQLNILFMLLLYWIVLMCCIFVVVLLCIVYLLCLQSKSQARCKQLWWKYEVIPKNKTSL